MHLTADRLLVVEGERIHAVAIVGASTLAIAMAGGLDHLRHALEDSGFRRVEIHAEAPSSWSRGRVVPSFSDLSWPIWIEATPTRTASLTRDITEEISILDAWDARDDKRAPLANPYAWEPGEPRRLVTFVMVFGVAYPLFVAGVA